MAHISGSEIALAFGQNNERKGWAARATSRSESGLDLVHFHSPSKLVTLTYDAMNHNFSVRFHKLHAQWGDYVRAIAKSLYYVLTVLKSAGLPFEAPLSPAGVQIIATATDDSTVLVEWPGMRCTQK